MEPGLALLRKKLRETWTEKHRNVARTIFLEGGWTQHKSMSTRSVQEVGAESNNLKEVVEVAKRYFYASSPRFLWTTRE